MLKVPTRLFILTLPMLGLEACAGAPSIVTPSAAGCSSLIPTAWSEGVEGAPLPDGNSVGDWVSFADAQTGRLDIANERTKATIGIVSRCEDRDREAVRRARRGFLARLF